MSTSDQEQVQDIEIQEFLDSLWDTVDPSDDDSTTESEEQEQVGED